MDKNIISSVPINGGAGHERGSWSYLNLKNSFMYVELFFFFENMFVYYVVPAVSQHKLTHRAVVSLRIKSTPAQTYQQPSFSAKQASTSDSYATLTASETTLSIGPGCSLVSRDRGQLPAMPLPVAPHDQLSSSCLLPNSSRLGVYIYMS